jgi:hypothetical protein
VFGFEKTTTRKHLPFSEWPTQMAIPLHRNDPKQLVADFMACKWDSAELTAKLNAYKGVNLES